MKQTRRIKPYAISSTLPIGITLDMILGMLNSYGYTIIHKPSKEYRGLNRLSLLSDKKSSTEYPYPQNPKNEAILYLAHGENLSNPLSITQATKGPLILYMPHSSDTAPLLHELQQSNHDSIAIVTSKQDYDLSYNMLITSIANYLTNTIEFGTALLQTAKNNGTFQDIINTAGAFLDLAVAVADANNTIVACSQNSTAIDFNNLPLNTLAQHEVPNDTKTDTKNPSEIVVYAPQPPFPYSLITYELRTKDTFFALLIMACPESEFNDDLLGAFSMIAQSCERIARREYKYAPVDNLALHGFLGKLFTESTLDRIFIQEQASKLHLPTHGAFTLACLSLRHNTNDWLMCMADEIDGMLKHAHWIHVMDDSIYILFYAKSWEDAMEASVALSELALNEPYEMYSSDVYSTLRDTCFAYKQITCIRKYIDLVKHYRSLTRSSKHAHVFAFHDVFCFFWDDPFAENDLRGFALDHTRSAIIEQDDIAHDTNNLPLLNAYLTLERKATVVGELFHLHRNGVLYRIDKIEKAYHLDLFDYLTRQYLQMCARIKLITGNKTDTSDTNALSAHMKRKDT